MNTSTQQICEDLLQVLGRFKYQITVVAEAHGLTRMQASILYALYKEDAQLMGQVAGAMHCDASNITGIVDRLVSGGLVVRQENERDRRRKSLHLTPQGQAVAEALMQEMAKRMGGALSAAERDHLHALLLKCC